MSRCLPTLQIPLSAHPPRCLPPKASHPKTPINLTYAKSSWVRDTPRTCMSPTRRHPDHPNNVLKDDMGKGYSSLTPRTCMSPIQRQHIIFGRFLRMICMTDTQVCPSRPVDLDCFSPARNPHLHQNLTCAKNSLVKLTLVDRDQRRKRLAEGSFPSLVTVQRRFRSWEPDFDGLKLF